MQAVAFARTAAAAACTAAAAAAACASAGSAGSAAFAPAVGAGSPQRASQMDAEAVSTEARGPAPAAGEFAAAVASVGAVYAVVALLNVAESLEYKDILN